MQNDSTDDDLHAALMAGDEAALGEAFSRHHERLSKYVQFRRDRRLASRVDADDLLQEAYLQAAQRLPHFAKQNELGRESTSDNAPHQLGVFLWLRLIVSQTLIDVHRRHLGTQKRDAGRDVALNARPGGGVLATSLSLAQGLVGKLTSPSQAAMKAELAAQLQTAIATMSDLDQEIIALRHFEQLTNTEIAQVMGIEAKAASIRYVRALKRLKAVLADLSGFRELQTVLA